MRKHLVFNMQYPDECIKGISNTNCFLMLGGSYVGSTNLFSFPQNRCRHDGWIEESINWNDDEYVVNRTLNQTKQNGELQFKIGIAIVPRAELDRVKKRYTGLLNYERDPIQEDFDSGTEANPYHGNVLLKGDITPSLKGQIRALLADGAEIRPRKEYGAE